MLSIAKLRVGQEAYQLSGVAQSLDDYYTGVGEAAGVWLGAGAEQLGLSGDVAPDDLRAVLAGMAPGSGGLSPNDATIRLHPRRVPGFDLTFKAPKSVSVLYAVSDDPRVQGAIVEAGEVALRAAIGWLEREAIWVRRGTGNEAFLNDLAARDPQAAATARIRSLPGQGLTAATFRHRTSRAGDPLLHWHTLVANLVPGPDGRWTAFVHPELYRAVRPAGEVFQTVLRGELTERLGLEWRPGEHVPEVAGVPAWLCRLFSKRSQEIEDWLAATGTPADASGRQAAVLATRKSKPEVEHERFDAAWKDEATQAGWGPTDAEALILSATDRQPPEVEEVWRLPTMAGRDGVTTVVVDRLVDPEEWIAAVARDLTEHESTFSRAQLMQAVAARIGEGATIATMERVAARVVASPQVIPIGGDGAEAKRWTSAELMAVERRFLDAVAGSRRTRPPMHTAQLERVIAGFGSLGADQQHAVRVLAGSSDAVSVLVGPAGTGKTFTMNVAARVFETAGYHVSGAAPSGKAADELETGAHIPSSTLHALLGSWARGFNLPGRQTVLVIDEAAMAGIRDLEQVVSAVVAAGGRVVAVGDHHQLPEVTAGGGFAAVANDAAATVVELRVNRRQDQTWERTALTELRDGHVATAVAAYRDQQRVVVVDDRPAMITAGVDRWFAAHHDGLIPVLLAGTNDTVTTLNHAVRARLLEGGWLGPVLDGTELAVGERLMIRVNDYRALTATGQQTRVLNGQTGTLTGVQAAGFVVRMDHDDSEVVLAREFMAGAVDYAYASTGHRAQGGTWDLAITVGLDGLYREAAYLVMSRGKQSNWIIVTGPELDAVDAELARHDSVLPLPGEEPADVDEELLTRFSTTRAKALALTQDPHAERVAAMATTSALAAMEARAAHARRAEEQASRLVGIDPHLTADRLARIDQTGRHVAVGHRVKAADRNNIGTVTAIDDTAGTVQVLFVAADGRSAERDMPWERVRILDPLHPAPRALTPTATATMERLTGPLRADLERWSRLLAAAGVEPSDRHVCETAARVTIDRAAAVLTAAEPDWLVELLGPRPLTRPAATQVWDDAVRDLAAHRARHGVVHPADPTGPDHSTGVDAVVWGAVAGPLGRARIWLDTHTSGPRIAVTRTRSAPELRQRERELLATLATAPPDCRQLIDRVRFGGMLPLEDTDELLRDALAAHGERRRWIIEHWPHVVEYTQVAHTLADGSHGPDVPSLVDTLARSTHPRLAVAAADGEPWLVTLTAQLVPANATTIDPTIERLLADVADYRHRWHLTAPLPLGDGAVDVDQANERAVLTLAIDHAVAPHAPRIDAPFGSDPLALSSGADLRLIEEGLGW